MSGHSKGTGTFMVQRLTALANIPLIGFFIWLVVSLAGADRARMVEVISHPLVAILTVVLLVSALVHMRIGMGEIIEDYVHEKRLKSLSMLLNTVFVAAVGVVGIISVFVLAFGG